MKQSHFPLLLLACALTGLTAHAQGLRYIAPLSLSGTEAPLVTQSDSADFPTSPEAQFPSVVAEPIDLLGVDPNAAHLPADCAAESIGCPGSTSDIIPNEMDILMKE